MFKILKILKLRLKKNFILINFFGNMIIAEFILLIKLKMNWLNIIGESSNGLLIHQI
jgi:hypothetical protein